jgi:hypothetical protein
MIHISTDYNKYKIGLIQFTKEKYPSRQFLREYLEYRLDNNPFGSLTRNALIALDDEKVIGHIILIGSKFQINGREVETVWGNDFFVSEEYRKSMVALDLMQFAVKNYSYLAYGIAPIALKLHSAFKQKLIAHLEYYIFLRPGSIILRALGHRPVKNHEFPEMVSISKGVRFHRVLNGDFRINDYLQNTDVVEPIRSKAFLNWRFFFLENRYFVYCNDENKDTYFVVRPVYYKGLNMLLLVDYRFDLTKKSDFLNILKGCRRLLKQIKFDGLITSSSLDMVSQMLKRRLFYNFRKSEIMSIISDLFPKNGETKKILVTLADSDGEFYFGKTGYSYGIKDIV